MQGAFVFGATIVSSDACRAGKRTPIGHDGARQARHLKARAVSNQMDGSRWLCDSGIESECFQDFWQVVSARSEREDAATLGIGKAADGDSIDSRSH